MASILPPLIQNKQITFKIESENPSLDLHVTLLKYVRSCCSNLFLLCFLYLTIVQSKGTFALLDRHLKLIYYILHFKGGYSWRPKYFFPEKVLWFETLLLQKPAWGRNRWGSLSGSFCSSFPLGVNLKPFRSLLKIGHTIGEGWKGAYVQCTEWAKTQD